MTTMAGDAADAAQMDHLQREIEKAIIPFRENTEAIIVVGALMRVARILLRLYKPDLRGQFTMASIAYLNGSKTLYEPAAKTPLETLGFYLPPGSKK